MQWWLVLHIISFICWYAGLFYCPRLFVYHSIKSSEKSPMPFHTMERRLYKGIMMPSMVTTLVSGTALIYLIWPISGYWIWIKLFCIVILLIFHFSCGYYIKQLKDGNCKRSSVFFRFYNEIPTILLIVIVIMAIIQPI